MLATEVLNSRRCDCEANHKCAHCIHCDIITPVTIRAAMRSIKRASDDVETALNLCASLYMLIGETQMKHRGRITNAKVYVYGTNSEPDICFHTRNYTGSKCSFGCVKRYDWRAKVWLVVCAVGGFVADIFKGLVCITMGWPFPYKKMIRDINLYENDVLIRDDIAEMLEKS